MSITDEQIERMGEAWQRLADGLFDFLADIDTPDETLADLDIAIRACRLLAESDEWTSEGVRYAVVPFDDALSPEPSPRSAHMCGRHGFDPMQGDVCPPCQP